MQQPQDIAHLFQEFGGQPDTYREITRMRAAQQARERWPLISALGDLSAGVPPVRAGEVAPPQPQEWRAAPPPAAPVAPELVRGGVEPTGLLPVAPLVPPMAVPSVQAVAAAAPQWNAAPLAPAPAPAPAVASVAVAAPVAPLPAAATVPPVAPAPVARAPAPVALSAPQPGPVQSPAGPAPVAAPAPVFQKPSPLSRLARSAPSEAGPSAGLQQVFARLLGTRGRP